MFLITLQQVSILLAYIFIGYFLRRKNLIGEQTGSILSKLLTYIFLPAYYISTLSKVSTENLSTYLSLLLAGVASLVVVFVVAHFLCKLFSKDEAVRNMFKYMLMFSNMGYFGYPLIDGVFGSTYLTMFMIYCLPISITLNTYGYYLLTKPTKAELLSEKRTTVKTKSLLSCILSPPLVASAIGLIIGLSPFTMPQFFYAFLAPAGNCMSACAMILSGSVLAKLPLKKLFLSTKGYLLSIVRLICFPIIGGGLVYLCGGRGELLVCVTTFLSLPTGMNVVVFPESVGRDSIEGAKACFISYVVALVTLPLVFLALKTLLGA